MLSQSFVVAAASMLALVTAMPTKPTGTPTPTISEGHATATSQGYVYPSADIPAKHFCNNFPLANGNNATAAFDDFQQEVDMPEASGPRKLPAPRLEDRQICVGPGPKVCRVFLTVGGAELSLCNDNPTEKCVNKVDIVARQAQLQKLCGPNDPSQSWSGQVLFADNTNIVLQAAK